MSENITYGIGGWMPGTPNAADVKRRWPALADENVMSYDETPDPAPPVVEADASATIRLRLSALNTQIATAQAAVRIATTVAGLRSATLTLDDLRGQQAALMSQLLA